MNYIPLLATLVACIFQVNADTALQGQFNLKFDIEYRPPYPSLDYCQWKNYTRLTCARHHIYPRSKLTAFYNKLLEKNDLFKLRQFFTAYKTNFEEYYNSLDPVKYKTTIQNVRDLVEGILKKTVTHIPSKPRPNNFDEFGAYFTWLPKDLFVGPDSRSDDPGDVFEEKSKYIIGNDDFKTISEIKKWIEDYLAGKSVSVYTLDEKFVLIFKKPSGNRGVLLPYPYKEDDWGRDDKVAKYYIKVKKQFEEASEEILIGSSGVDEQLVPETTVPPL